ncbi:shikimate dehydrogenase [Blautia pseudococcoides]|uniref:Shikimate dehydrogenase (NADP(+)) n=1 Tax=Blautia pseudococcoides TaxID=1796616 RepID=A0A1C7I6Y6_9FIRM|nr:shikimate dehydrogenase [Blautia pseudococcoides]ANU74768.1 shikimate dehydrogenase [Blautia pseudococcoides]ASU27575.1 shikimate dehydrogenase [Blautia pseudococcoides]QQQ95582.1 shikimate dehydrogenase [Blautia pseudococcoides]
MIPITGYTQLTGLLGSPVKHSISPMMHNTGFQALGLDFVYLCFEVNEESLEDAVKGLRTLHVKGFNLTMPNKNKILEYLDELSPAARLIGAVNTVENREGKLIGHNTDGIGFMRAVRAQDIGVAGKCITLMGIGGAATAICTQAALDGAGRIYVFARMTSKYLPRMKELIWRLKKETGCEILLCDNEDRDRLKKSLRESVLLVNATSVGMEPDEEGCILPGKDYLHEGLAVGDIVYDPWETRLLRMAKEAGCKGFNGYAMLLYQGAEAFRIWTGREMPLEVVREKLGK